MKSRKRVLLLSAAGLLIGVRLLLPSASQTLRHQAPASDYAETFLRLGARLQTTAEPEPEQIVPVASVRSAATEIVSYLVEEAEVFGEAEPIPTPLPAAVTAFLEAQAAFSDYALPEKVDYSYVPLPFAYTVPVAGYNSSGFGYRVHPILNTVRFHYGTDFAAWTGTGVQAFADGTVTFAGCCDSYGNYLTIDHGGGWQTLYAHCSKLCVAWGQTVRRGQQIALVGESGMATGPHLHFELTKDGTYCNPEYYVNQ